MCAEAFQNVLLKDKGLQKTTKLMLKWYGNFIPRLLKENCHFWDTFKMDVGRWPSITQKSPALRIVSLNCSLKG